MPTNRDKLKQIKLDHNLSNADLAKLMDVSIYTITSWLYPETSQAHRLMPNREIKYLTLLLKSK